MFLNRDGYGTLLTLMHLWLSNSHVTSDILRDADDLALTMYKLRYRHSHAGFTTTTARQACVTLDEVHTPNMG